MEKLEAEAVLLARSLQQLTRVEYDGADPLARFHFVALVQKHYAWLQYDVQFHPVLEAASDLQPVRQHYDTLVSHYREHVVRDSLLLCEIIFFLFLEFGKKNK